MTDALTDRPDGSSGRVLDLLERWQSLERQGQSVTPAELCTDCPELTGEIEQFAQFVRRVENLSTAPGARDTDGPGLLPTLAPEEAATRSASAAPAEERYAIEDKLGEGGMGAVYRARDRLLGRIVALKVIQPEAMSSAMRARFESEARAVARLDHPHIVKVFDVGQVQLPSEPAPVPFLTLEFVDGGSLTRQLGCEALPPTQAARLIALLARAMQHAHDRGIIHRDLKPDNVLLAPASSLAVLNTPLGCPKITDFGLAREVAAGKGLTRTGAVMGTPNYMAPEQADGLPNVGPPADVWALGVILYRLLAGKLPFASPSLVDLLHQICREEPPPLPQVHPRIPPKLSAIVHDCLKKRPEERPTAGQLAERLESFLRTAGEPETLSQPLTLPETLRRRPRFRRLWIGMAASLSVVLLAGLTWHFWLAPSHDRVPDSPPDDQPPVVDNTKPLPGKPLKIKPLQVMHFREAKGEEIADQLGLIGLKSFVTRHSDEVKLTVKLSGPGYLYLIGFNFDGKEQLLWPTREQEAPAQRTTLDFPENRNERWDLNDKAQSGLQAYVVAASSKPLPPYREWRTGRTGVSWQPLPPGKTVWEADPEGAYPLTQGLSPDRGSIKKVAGGPPLAELCQALLGGGVEVVEAIAFPVLPKEGER